MEEYFYDIVILGAGPAGLSAGLYGARGGSSVAILDVSVPGGQPNYYQDIENYPGVEGISSYQLASKMLEQAEKFGSKIYECQSIRKVDLNKKEVTTQDSLFKAKAIIIATGAKPKLLNIPGEKEFIGRGVSYCAICDGAFYKDKEIAVIGGGNSAVEEACYLTKFASKVNIIYRGGRLKADKILRARALSNPKIEVWYNCDLHEIEGDKRVTSIYFHEEGEPVRLEVAGVFPYIGLSANTELFDPEELHMNNGGFIVVTYDTYTSLDGVFAAGDVREKDVRQVITAASDGAIAGIKANKYLDLVGRWK